MRKLTLILCSRNDNYCGDSVGRLQRVLNHTGDILRGREAEVIVSDWGSEEPLKDVLNLSDNARAITRFNYISSDKTSRIPTRFSEVHALNSAARLATGEFIGRIDQDTFIGERFVEWFYDGTEPSEERSYWAGRKELPPGKYYENRGEAARDERPGNVDPVHFWGSSTGIFLVPAKHFRAIGGYDETNIFVNHMEREFVFRLKQVAELVDLGRLLDYDFYHICHGLMDNKTRSLNRMLTVEELEALPLKPNGDDWGTVSYHGELDRLSRLKAAARGYRAAVGYILKKLGLRRNGKWTLFGRA